MVGSDRCIHEAVAAADGVTQRRARVSKRGASRHQSVSRRQEKGAGGRGKGGRTREKQGAAELEQEQAEEEAELKQEQEQVQEKEREQEEEQAEEKGLSTTSTASFARKSSDKKTRAAASNAVAAEADSGDESAVALRGGQTFGAELELRPDVWGSVGGAPYLSLGRWFAIALVVAVVLGTARSRRLGDNRPYDRGLP